MAFNNAWEPSRVVCSDGITVDEQPAVITSINISNVYARPGIVWGSIEGTRRAPYNRTPTGANSISAGPAHVLRAQWGCIVRVVSLTKSRIIPNRKDLPLFPMIRRHACLA